MKVRWIGFAAWAGLLLLQLVWHAWLVPPKTSLLVTLAIALVPLLLPLLALRNPRRAVLWAAIVSLLYFSHGIAEVMAYPELRLLGAIEIALCVLLVVATGLDGRGKQEVKLP